MGIWTRLATAGKPPAKGTVAFAVWNRLTKLNTLLYQRTGGRLGGRFDGAPVLLLHHIGRKTGTARVTPVLYLPDGEDFVIVASWGGAPENPAWFHNLKAAPDTEIEVGGRRVPVRAEIADAARRAELWPKVVSLYGGYETYQGRTEREIPLVVLRPR